MLITYTPENILGYRLQNNGACVSRILPLEEKEQYVFAEYLLKGGISLYYCSGEYGNYFYFEGEDGKIALVCESRYVDNDIQETINLRRNDMNAVSQVFNKSPQTVSRLWKMDYNHESLTDITRSYLEGGYGI